MTETELRHESELADARLEVAEDLWWPMAIATAAAAHFWWANWLLTIAFFVAVYFLVVYRYRKSADKAEDEYYRVAHLGKYSLLHEEGDV